MRLQATLDPTDFPEAERAALRLDGDVFALGDTVVPIDTPVTAAVRAASIARRARPGLIAAGRTAAWIHGADPVLAEPRTWVVDVAAGNRVHGRRPEIRYGRLELVRIGGVDVTAPIRTAFDLLRERPHDDAAAAVCRRLLVLAGLDAAAVRRAAIAFPGAAHKRRAIDRLVLLAS